LAVIPELVKRKWADGLIAEIQRLTGSTIFTYVPAVTRLRGDASIWQEHTPSETIDAESIKLLTLQDILSDLYKNTNTTWRLPKSGGFCR